MSTRPPSVLRLIEKQPARGDQHPVPFGSLESAIRSLPPHYLAGLKSIELCARTGKIGRPFALYGELDRVILLYSLPLVWRLKSIGPAVLHSLRSGGARIQTHRVDRNRSNATVYWSPKQLESWYRAYVLAHELGHHAAARTAQSRRISPTDAYHEAAAERHARRIREALR